MLRKSLKISLTSTEKEPVRVRDGENTGTMYQRNIWQAEIHEKANPDVKFDMMGQPQGNLNNGQAEKMKSRAFSNAEKLKKLSADERGNVPPEMNNQAEKLKAVGNQAVINTAMSVKMKNAKQYFDRKVATLKPSEKIKVLAYERATIDMWQDKSEEKRSIALTNFYHNAVDTIHDGKSTLSPAMNITAAQNSLSNHATHELKNERDYDMGR